jgi:plasmid stabilization system protein ParE
MSLPLHVRVSAREDLAEAHEWYEGKKKGLGERFLNEVEITFRGIQAFPESRAAEYRGVHRALVKRFPYVVYYRIGAESIEVLAVQHGKRDPQSWKLRV